MNICMNTITHRIYNYSGKILKVLLEIKNILFRPFLIKLQKQELLNEIIANYNFQTRSMVKQLNNMPINVLFVCHEPALWEMFDSVYRCMVNDPIFSPKVVVLPYRNPIISKYKYQETEMNNFCSEKKLIAINGYDKDKKIWLKPDSLMPDYVFFQVPYNYYPPLWSVETISKIAKVCYIPYGSSVAKGDIAKIVHPEQFFKHTSLIFLENDWKKEIFKQMFQNKYWFENKTVVVSGYPKLDYLKANESYTGYAWKRGQNENIKRILWTPRFLTSEGTCHFFEYKDFFFDFCKNHPEVDFVFRPHPLCFQNFIKTGEMTLEEITRLKKLYEQSHNMAIDESGSYKDSFMTSDLLISDYSSMMVEYFATGKPIIYTHRKNEFNDYALNLSKGMYWVENQKDLEEKILMILNGIDPLKDFRQKLISKMYYFPENGAGYEIKKQIEYDFKHPLILQV